MRTPALAVFFAVSVALVAAVPAAADPAVVGFPNSIAATGDSITQAYDADSKFPPGERPQYSWVTGTAPAVNSFYQRLLAANPAIAGNAFNDSVTGANMIDLAGQVTNAIAQNAQEVTILLGANDVCTSSVDTMTAPADFSAQFKAAMRKLSLGLPDARIQVVSILNVYQLWSVLKDSSAARTVWSLAQICQSMLANPLSTAQVDVDRRAAVLARETEFNATLKKVCHKYIHCRFDGDAAFDYPFTPGDADTLDYFHPSISGQATLAGVAWDSGFDFSDTTAPVSSSTVTPVAGGATVALTASDDAGVSGIEYRLGHGHYKRYRAPVTVATGKAITWRAVDVNGNIEATQSLVI